MNSLCRAGLCWLVRLSATLFALTAVSAPIALAGPIDKYTGYTRIGHPPSPKGGDRKDKEKPAEDEKAIGVTIYFMVLDRKTGRKGTYGDTWGVGIRNFDSFFVSGRNNDIEKLDVEARYLYLYQVVNDREGTRTAVKDVTVRLIVDPRLVTSWGHFRIREEDKEKAPVKGAGFTMDFLDPKEKEEKFVVRPISTLFAGVSDRRYQNPAPAIKAPRPYGITAIDVGKVQNVADEADVGKAPEDVLLVPNADFGTPPKSDSVYLAPARTSDLEKLLPSDDLDARKRIREAYRNRWPAIRAFWREPDNQIKPRQRSTIFGFTSDLAPTLETVAIGGRGMGINVGKLQQGREPDEVPVQHHPTAFVTGEPGEMRRFLLGQRGDVSGTTLPPISGTLPTPTYPSTPAAQVREDEPREKKGGLSGSPRSQAPVMPMWGGSPVGGGGGSSSSGGLLAGTGGFGSGGLGGGFGGGSGGGGSSGQASPAQSSAPPAGQRTTVTVDNQSLAVANNSQLQGQAQSQAQTQGQTQSQKPDGNVVPVTPAWLLGVLGLPVFYFLARRRKGRRAGPAP